MTPQEIALIVILVVIAGYVVAALLSRSKSGEESPDIVLEARLPQSATPREALIPPADATSQKNIRRPRKKRSASGNSKVRETPEKARTQQHHVSPKPVAKAPDKPVPEKIEKTTSAIGVAGAESASPVATPAPGSVAEPKPKPKQPDAIDPELTGQILELDDRLDAIEKLVASIEESLATFDPLEDVPKTDDARAA